MNRIVVTVGPQHTLREAARRMTTHNVGAAVVMDPDGLGLAIITERDILRSTGRDEDPDAERVADHLTGELRYAEPEWSLDRAAEMMTVHAIRHVVVIVGNEPTGILSMRDIVRCWLSEGAHCDVGQEGRSDLGRA